MDQVRAILRATWQQRFWVLSVLGPLVAVACWMMASGSLQAAFKTNRDAINGQFSAMATITGQPIHGNEDVNAEERKQASQVSASVRDLWTRLYDSQREQVLSWPATLGEEFLEYIEKRKFNEPIPAKLRSLYLNYIKNQFDALVMIVDAKKLDFATGALPGVGAERPEMGAEYRIGANMPGVEKDYLVDWIDQSELRQKLDFEGVVPSARKIWVTQEDLWVFETLLNVIKKTNDARGATRAAENAAIRVITAIEVGQDAAKAMIEKGNVIMPEASAGSEPVMETGPPEVAPMFLEDQGDAAMADAQLLASRYVDQLGVPIPDGATGLGVEYRRLPVRMVLIVDQRWIPRVLVECANAPLPIEVQRVRINPEQSRAGFEGAMSTGGRGPEAGPRSYSPFSPGGNTSMPEGLSKDYVTLEIQGLVYIFNEPNATELTVPGAEEEAAAAAAVAMQPTTPVVN